MTEPLRTQHNTTEANLILRRLPEDVRALTQEKAVAINCRRLHPNMRRAFKVWCTKRGVSMERAIEQFIQAVVSGEVDFQITPSHNLT